VEEIEIKEKLKSIYILKNPKQFTILQLIFKLSTLHFGNYHFQPDQSIFFNVGRQLCQLVL
jgi:hypothetical protein